MSNIILIAWGRTDWADQNRLIGRTDLPLNDAGRAEVAALADSLAAAPPAVLTCGPEESARETAGILGKRLSLRVGRPLKDLHELHLGLWAGLTESEIEQRFTTAYEDWRNAPDAFCPPDGEPVADAAARLHRSAERAVKKHPGETVAFVVGPFAAALLRCRFESLSLDQFWSLVDARQLMHIITIT